MSSTLAAAVSLDAYQYSSFRIVPVTESSCLSADVWQIVMKQRKRIFFLCTCGFSINICAISFLFTASIVGSSDIFLRADARASGLWVSSAEPASARYSRFLDNANLNSDEIRSPTSASNKSNNYCPSATILLASSSSSELH